MLNITNSISIPLTEITITAIRSQGAGGQNVNKVASAAHLRFDISASSLPDQFKERLLALHDHRITTDGVVIIKAQQYRSQEQNREAALARLQQLVRSVATTPKRRKATRPSRAAQRKRMDSKTRHGRLKTMRQKVVQE